MKKLLLPFAIATMMATSSSCERADLQQQQSEQSTATKQVQFVMKGLQVDYVTRATLQSESITDLYIWEGTTLLKHQQSTDSDFGTPTVTLTIGAHDLTFVASKADGQSWANGMWQCTKVKDTYGAMLAYTVSKSSSSKQVELKRLNGKVMWTIEDAMPSDAKQITISIPQCFALDASLNGASQSVYESKIDVSGYAGTTGTAVSLMVLPENHAEGSSVNATIAVSNATTALCTYTNAVTIKANQVCNIHGSFFSNATALSFSLSNAWGATTDYDI